MEIDHEKIDSNFKKDHKIFHFRYVVYVIVILLLLLSLISYDPSDQDILSGGVDAPLKNWIGPFGAYFSGILILLFGLASYPILILLIVSTLRPFLSSIPPRRHGYSGALISVIFGLLVIFGMFPAELSSLTESLGIGTTGDNKLSSLSGGVIGQFFAAPEGSVRPGILYGFIGAVGTFIVGSVFLLTGLVFIWFADWYNVLKNYLDERRKILEITGEIPSSLSEKRKKEREEKLKQMLDNYKGNDKESASLTDKKSETGEPLVKEEVIEKNETEKSVDRVESKKENTPSINAISSEKKLIKEKKAGKTIHYELPPLSLLEKGAKIEGESGEIIEASKRVIEETLQHFNIEGQVVAVVSGPRVTRYEIMLAPNININKITALQRNFAMQLEAESLRMLAPIPGKNTIGLEVPNSTVSTITLRSIMETDAWQRNRMEIPVILGRDVSGKPVITDLAKTPHMLIAGATGSGKSVCMHSIILSMLYKFSPFEMRFILVDPKMVEFTWYKPLPHLNIEVVNVVKNVPRALRWGVNEMERRYKLFSELKARNLLSFNSRDRTKDPESDSDGNPIPDSLPYIVIIIDELADIMMTEYKQDVETSIARIAQKGRAAGIHMIIATQTPRTTIITGAIKANIPTRIALQVSSQIDSRVIIDGQGAEKLLGKGDMLFTPPGSSNLERVQGTFIQDHEIENVVRFISSQVEQSFDESILMSDEDEEGDIKTTGKPELDDIIKKYLADSDNELLKKALETILLDKKVSTSYIQRRLGIGYNKAAELVEELERRGIVGPPVGASAKREILIEGYEDIKAKEEEV
ncbi:MAG TPA: DNA translocase FtsK 4TM domain-containing protein [Victivallales bacterium]|nr:DNA translocase FtsK 4TM domain-containing protein [Victivallales bacterium]